MKPVTVSDLKSTEARPRGAGACMLHCEECHAEYSASPGDYWSVSPSHVFECCGEPMRLVRKVVRLVDVPRAAAQVRS